MILFLLLSGFSSFIYAQECPELQGNYLGQTPPSDTPVVFARGIVSLPDRSEYKIIFFRSFR